MKADPDHQSKRPIRDITPAADAPRRSRAPLAITAAIIAGLVVAFFIFAGLYADVLWFDQLGFLSVLTTQWIAGVVMFLDRLPRHGRAGLGQHPARLPLRPVYAKLNSQLDRYQQVIEPLRRLAMCGIPALLGLFAGVAAATRWQTILMWLNRTEVGHGPTRSSASTSRSTSSTCRSSSRCSASPRPSCSSAALVAARDRLPLRRRSASAAVRCASPRPRASRSPSPPASTCCCRPSASGSTSTRR